jgi:glycerophosphoryl diester phosphodiesterase
VNRPPFIPRVIGHRGAAAKAPENTLAGFRRAAELGCRWVEFDVRLSLDDHPIVFHDDTLERTTDGAGIVGATPLDELLQRDAGSHFGHKFRGEPIPTLDQALALLRALGLGGNLEMKAEDGREEALAEAVTRAIGRIGTKPLPSLLVTSFSAPAIGAFARLAPDIARGLLAARLVPDWPRSAARLGAVAIVCDHETLRPEEVKAVRRTDLSLVTYTINEPHRALELFAWGVDSIISDAPDAVLAALAK